MTTSRCIGGFGLRRLVLGDEERHFSQPFTLEHERVPNHGCAADIESRLTFDATDGRPSEIVEQSLSAIQHTFASRLLSVRGPEEDEGYSSLFNKDPNAWGKACPSGFSRASSSPLLSPETSFHPKSSKLRCHDLSWNIGLPLMESSMCHTLRGNLNAGGKQRWQVQGHVLEPAGECWTTLAEQHSTLDPGYETTLPLQAKVKSVVEVPGRPTHPAGNPPSRQTRMAQREVDWEFEKRFYLDSVKKQISDNQARRQDVMTELVNLMTETNCSAGSSAPQPQHPTDLTRRNYQRRWRSLVPSVTLQEWQLKHCETGKRFANVSDHFRSSLSRF